MLALGGKQDNIVKFFEVTDSFQVAYLNEYKMSDASRGFCFGGVGNDVTTDIPNIYNVRREVSENEGLSAPSSSWPH